ESLIAHFPLYLISVSLACLCIFSRVCLRICSKREQMREYLCLLLLTQLNLAAVIGDFVTFASLMRQM
ncbi:hypothetical protein HMPREF1572_01269, partial [Gardnerella vaginalis JCP7275]